MKYFIFILLIPTLLFAQLEEEQFVTSNGEQAVFFDASLYYNCIVRKEYKDVIGIFEGGASAGFYYKDNPYYAHVTVSSGFSIDGSAELKRLDYHGHVEGLFSYFLKPVWEFFAIQTNEYASASNLYWRTYTGGGAKIRAYDNHDVFLKFTLAPVLHYERFLPDREYDIPEHDRLTMSHMLGAYISYDFLIRLTLIADWKVIPLYDFSECRVMADLTLRVLLFRDRMDRKSGGDFEMTFSVDHFTHPPTYQKETDYIVTTALKFYM